MNNRSTKSASSARGRGRRNAAKNMATKKTGKGRRKIFKMRKPTKAPTAVATAVTCETLFHKGTYYTIGDIVSVVDYQQRLYYAQIRGLLQDHYFEKSAVITWLIPTQITPRDHFDPATYVSGPEEVIPRKLDWLEFVCHAPIDYYKPLNSPYPTLPSRPESGFIWTRLDAPKIVPRPCKDEKKDVKSKTNPNVKNGGKASTECKPKPEATKAESNASKHKYLLCLAEAAAEFQKMASTK